MVRRGMIREVRQVFNIARDGVDDEEENAGREKKRIGALKLEVVRFIRAHRHDGLDVEEETGPPQDVEEKPARKVPEPAPSSTRATKKEARGRGHQERKGPGIAKARPTQRAPKKGVA